MRETARFVETALPVEIKIEAEWRVLLPERLVEIELRRRRRRITSLQWMTTDHAGHADKAHSASTDLRWNILTCHGFDQENLATGRSVGLSWGRANRFEEPQVERPAPEQEALARDRPCESDGISALPLADKVDASVEYQKRQQWVCLTEILEKGIKVADRLEEAAGDAPSNEVLV